MESRLYPVVYDPRLAYLAELGKEEFTLDNALPTIEEIQESAGTKSEEQTELIKSGIMVGLNRAITKSREDYESVLYLKFTGDIVTDQIISEDRENYYDTRIYAQANQICDYIDGLIKLDKYPPHLFGEYKQLRNFLKSSHDNKENARVLGMLRILAEQMIPVEILYPQEEVVESSILSASQITEG